MMPTARTRVRTLAALTLALIAAVSCAEAPPPTPDLVPVEPGPEPPTALLLVEGAFPVAAQLGSYTWLGGGSDAPWLQGSPAGLPAGEQLRVELRPALPILRWSVRYAPAGADGPGGAVELGEGLIRGRVLESEAPPRGRWTVELFVTFGAGLGSARYYWLVDVR
jgi:hypothetical protein